MKVNGTIINYYIHCKRQCYLCANRLNLQEITYEVKDEVIDLSRKAVGSEFVASYELNDDGTVLTYITGDMPQGEFKKITD